VNNANQPQSARSYELLQSYLKNLFVFLWVSFCLFKIWMLLKSDFN
jgi:hypothetical protein